MEISAIAGSISVQSRITQQSADRINNTNELGSTSLASKIESSGDDFGGQQELFSALVQRLEENNSTTIEISLNINVIKANLGSLLALVLDRDGQGTLDTLLGENGIIANDDQVSPDVQERYINALITGGIDDGGLFGTEGGLTTYNELRESVNSLSTSQTDGRQLLLDLLIGELGTPQDDATSILSTLLSQPFQAVA